MDEDALSYLVTGLPGATLTPTSVYGQALLEWTPTAAQIGSYTASVTATDSGNGLTDAASDSRSFTVVVRAANSAPLLAPVGNKQVTERSEEHTSELQSLMRISYAVFCLKKKNEQSRTHATHPNPFTTRLT